MDKELERSDRNWDGTVNWDAVQHQQLHDWFAQPRLDSMQGSAEAWTESVAAHFQAAADEVNQALRTAGVHWEGQAAESMQEASNPLAEHALAAKDAATLAGDKTQTQLVQAKWVAATMPKPHPAPAQPAAIDTLPGNLPQHFDDVREQEAAAQEAEERARDLAKTYDSTTDGDVAELPTFEVAPKATADVGEPPEKKIERGDPGPGPGPGPGEPGPGEPGPGGPGPDAGPDPEPGPAPGPEPGTSTPGPGDTTGSSPDDSGTSGQSATPPAGNSTGVPTGGTPVDTQRPTSASPGAGVVTGGPGTTGGSPRGGAGGGPGAGGAGGTGGRPAPAPAPAPGPGSGAGVRGAVPGEGPAAARGGAAGRGAAGMGGMAPMGGGRGRGDDDTERTSPDYLKDFNDTFWDDTPPLAPPVIGEDDDEE